MQKRAWFAKREEAAPTGQGVAGKAMSHACRFCGKTEGDIPFKQCSACKAVRYCSKACQADHWKEHKTLSSYINFGRPKLSRRQGAIADICQSFIAAGTCTSDSSCWAEVYSEVSFKWG